MIRYSVLYPQTDGAEFDHSYYRDSHIPLAVSTFKPLSYQVDRGLDGPYVASVHMIFESMDQYTAAVGSPDAKAVRDDIPNYTTIRPLRQISEVVDSPS